MNTYETNEEQIEAIKGWWKRNKTFAIATIVLTIALSLGWHWWQEARLNYRTSASTIYEQMLTELLQDGNKNRATAMANELVKYYPQTPYADLAALVQAKQAVEENHLDEAKERLDWVTQHAKDKTLVQIAYLRATRLLLVQHKPDEALKSLDNVTGPAFQPAVNAIKANIFLALKQPEKAIEAYQTALAQIDENDSIRPLIQMQHDDITPTSK